MRILFLTPTSPVPTDAGNKTLTAGLLQHVSSRHDCDLIALTHPRQDRTDIERILLASYPGLRHVAVLPALAGGRWRLAQLVALARGDHPALARFKSRPLAHWLRANATAGAYDVVHFDMIRMAQYRRWCPHLPSVLIGSDAYSLAARQARLAASGHRAAFDAMLQETLFRRYEKREYPRFDLLAVVGEPDARYLRDLCPGLDVRVVGIPLPAAFQTARIRAFEDAPGQPPILVCGSLNHPVVAHGVAEFLEDCRAYMASGPPGCVTVLGQNPHPLLVDLMRRLDYVRHIAYVHDYAQFLQQDWVYVYPQKCGTGLQTKVQQAMSVGLPCVGYAEAFGGLRVSPGTDAFVCRTPDQLHHNVASLLTDARLRQQIGSAGAHHVRRCFSVESVGEELVALYAEAAARHA